MMIADMHDVRRSGTFASLLSAPAALISATPAGGALG